MIFLSDGECMVPDSAIEDLCNTAVRHGCVIFLVQRRSLILVKGCHYHSILSPSAWTLPPLSSAGCCYRIIRPPLVVILPFPSVGCPIWLSKSREMPLAIL